MKKYLNLILSLFLIVSLFTSCKSNFKSVNNFENLKFFEADSKIINSVPKNYFSEDIECEFGDKKITVSAPKFTGLPVTAVYSYKKTYDFIDGATLFEAKTHESGSTGFLIDKNGIMLTNSTEEGYNKIIDKRDMGRYFKSEEVQLSPSIDGTLIGENAVKVQFGNPDNYTQYLYNTAGERISAGYDCIGYFYEGLALIVKDKKVGLIDENGNEVLTPTIHFDTLSYEPYNTDYRPIYMTEDAFVLPIGGEFAIINIER